MRELVINKIKSSRCYIKLYEAGEKTPLLNLMTNEDLLDYYDFCMSH